MVGGTRLRGLLLTLTGILAAACAPGVPGFPGMAAGTDSFAGRLTLLPASIAADADVLTVTMADLDRAAELAGVQRPLDPGNTEVVTDYLLAVTGSAREGSEPSSVAALTPETAHLDQGPVDEFAGEVGWSIVDLAWFAEVQNQNAPDQLMVAGGNIDEGRLNDAMGERQDGIWRLGGEDGEIDVMATSAARPLGESLRTAVTDGRLVVGRTTPPVLDALDGGGPTLADNPVLQSLAAAMDDNGAYSAILTAGGSYVAAISRAGATPLALVELQDQVLPQPFRGVAGGLTDEGGAPIVLLAYAHDSAEAATANADALGRLLGQGNSVLSERPWSTLLTVDEIRTDGSTLIARLRLTDKGNPQLAYQLLQARDSIVMHR